MGSTAAGRERVRHPVFARIYQRVAAAAEDAGAAGHRDRLLAGSVGRVVEVGAGTRLNFAHYPTTVTDVVAVEPEPYLRVRAEEAAARAAVAVRVVDGTAIPLDDQSVDARVCEPCWMSKLSAQHLLGRARWLVGRR